MTMTLISTVEVGAGGTTAMVFNNVPQTFTDLLLVYSLRGNASGEDQEFPLYFNGNGADYSFRRLYGTGSSTGSDNASSAIGLVASAATSTINTFGNGQAYIPNYTSSSEKAYSIDGVSENNNGNRAVQQLVAGRWANTAAITNVSIQGSTIQQYSTATLYGILKGSGGATVS